MNFKTLERIFIIMIIYIYIIIGMNNIYTLYMQAMNKKPRII